MKQLEYSSVQSVYSFKKLFITLFLGKLEGKLYLFY